MKIKIYLTETLFEHWEDNADIGVSLYLKVSDDIILADESWSQDGYQLSTLEPEHFKKLENGEYSDENLTFIGYL